MHDIYIHIIHTLIYYGVLSLCQRCVAFHSLSILLSNLTNSSVKVHECCAISCGLEMKIKTLMRALLDEKASILLWELIGSRRSKQD